MKFIWFTACEWPFKSIKNKIASDRVLKHFNPNLPLMLATDASLYVFSLVRPGVILNNTENPIGFLSGTLKNVKKRHRKVANAALSITFRLNFFFQYLHGRRLTFVHRQ